MYAIIETGGKQYKVAEGDIIRCDLLESEVGSDVTFDRVVLGASGDDVKVGAPLLVRRKGCRGGKHTGCSKRNRPAGNQSYPGQKASRREPG